MIPETSGALLAFLGLIAPGLVFEIRRERRRQGADDSAFREASRIALSSLAFTALALAMVAIVRVVHPSWTIDVGVWVSDGAMYFASNTALVVWNGFAIVVASVGLAALFEHLTGRSSPPSLAQGTLWNEIFKQRRKPGKSTWVGLSMKSGQSLFGFVERYSVDGNDKDPDLFIVGPDLSWRPAASDDNPTPDLVRLGEWDGIHVRSTEIEWMRFQYRDSE